ncbi:LLM class flavin-dependent oxidoreductase [Catenuloplanes japonicus]|uniref:LLM class flavin-dependent oxidoreductase n=1 Tax=Catenuloplanes japonicus TaxID=33876 RepID=UPI0005245B8A|nr:LLM class flavin-dependent oxidoreductase [Catenuloplanes japonicus]
MGIALSALELALTEDGRTATEALDAAGRAVKAVDELGYRRVWFAEHHGAGIASSVVPAVLIAHYAAQTGRIRLGSGGVLAPNHAPLALAEQFATLAALHPDRIDLGVGRGPGTHDEKIIRGLRRGGEPSTDAEYQADVAELIGYLSGEAGVALINGWPPAAGGPAPWLLSSSPAGAELAARLGLPIALAHHIRPDNTVAAAARYRELFTPSRWADRPYVMICVETIVADTDEEAARLGRAMDVAKVGAMTGQIALALPTPAQAESHGVPEAARDMIAAHSASQARGSVETVARRFTDLVDQTGADELMLFCGVYDPQARVRSYELAAKAAGLS